MCTEMARFANSTPVGETRSVKLVTDWGNLAKACSDGGTRSGKESCDWLIQNTSTEFQHHNIRRALVCLGDSGIWAGQGLAACFQTTWPGESSPMLPEAQMKTCELKSSTRTVLRVSYPRSRLRRNAGSSMIDGCATKNVCKKARLISFVGLPCVGVAAARYWRLVQR